MKGDRRHDCISSSAPSGPARLWGSRGSEETRASTWFLQCQGPQTAGEGLERGSLRQGAPRGAGGWGVGSTNAGQVGRVSTGRGRQLGAGVQVQSYCGAGACVQPGGAAGLDALPQGSFYCPSPVALRSHFLCRLRVSSRPCSFRAHTRCYF